MPFGVRKWPDSCDPRGPCFCIRAYAPGAVPPYKFRLKTTFALPPLAYLNLGELCTFNLQIGISCRYPNPAPPPDTTACELSITPLFDWNNVPPPGHTIEWIVFCGIGTPSEHSGQVSARFPFAVDQPPSVTMRALVGPELIPNPLELIPQPWDET